MSLLPLVSAFNASFVPDQQSGLTSSAGTDPSALNEAAGAGAKSEEGASATVQLSEKAKALVRSLQARDQQVHAHEAAHLAASGGLATSGASYTYQRGPDGVSYAIGGEVSIDVSRGRSPEETIARAALVRAAALAPADPSGQDLAVAAAASQMEQQARAELLQQQLREQVAYSYQSSFTSTSAAQAAQIKHIDQLA